MKKRVTLGLERGGTPSFFNGKLVVSGWYSEFMEGTREEFQSLGLEEVYGSINLDRCFVTSSNVCWCR